MLRINRCSWIIAIAKSQLIWFFTILPVILTQIDWLVKWHFCSIFNITIKLTFERFQVQFNVSLLLICNEHRSWVNNTVSRTKWNNIIHIVERHINKKCVKAREMHTWYNRRRCKKENEISSIFGETQGKNGYDTEGFILDNISKIMRSVYMK